MNPIRRHALQGIMTLLAAAGLGVTPAMAQDADWPQRPVRIVVPFPPGGAIDAMIRVVAPSLEKSLGQSVVIENKAGAGGVVGTEYALRATDGHTLLMTAMGHTIYPSLNKDLSFDPVKDFKAIAPIGLVPNVAVVPANSPFGTLGELIAYAKANPGKLSYGSAGNGTSLHLSAAQFASLAGIDMTHVPYRGSAPAITDLVAGRIDLMFDSSTSARPFLADNRIKALAVATTNRTPLFPDLPTVAEAGVKDYRIDWWYGLVAPASLSDAAVQKVADAVAAAWQDPEMAGRFEQIRVDPMRMERQAFGALIAQNHKEWQERIAAMGIQAN